MDSYTEIIFALVCILIILFWYKYNEGNQVAAYQTPIIRIINKDGFSVEKKEILGKGAFGIVYSGELDEQKVAVQMLKDGDIDKRQIENFELEINRMMNITPHTNIIKLLGICIHEENLYSILEYASQGDIGNFLKSKHSQSSQKDLLSYAKQVAQGMKHLHEKCNLIHNDLAARNILVVTDESGHIIMKIANFGFSIYIKTSCLEEYNEQKNKLLEHKERRRVEWMAPEALENNYTLKSDVWSYGVLLWEIYSHGQCTPHRIKYDLLKKGERLAKPDGCPDPVYDLMNECWEFDKTKRPEFQKVISLLTTEQIIVLRKILTGNVI